MTANPSGRLRVSSESSVRTIGTHDGTFHCDEVLAVYMLKVLPEFKDAQVIRTRDMEILNTCNIVVDVGGEFNPATLRFDHHQRSFEHSVSSLIEGKPWVTRLSSAGLVYVHYGKQIIAEILKKKVDDEVVVKLFDKIYENFIEEIDAIDNGVSVSDGKLKYRVTSTLSSRVGRLNPSWRSDRSVEPTEQFNKALNLVGTEFTECVHLYATDWWEAYSVVAAAVDSRFDVDRSGEIIQFTNGGCPWKEHLEEIEKETGITPVKFVMYPDQKGLWRIQAVPISTGSFISRVPLHPKWQGLRDKELEEMCKIPTASFVHATGFIGGAAERESCIQMARLSLANHKEVSEIN